MSPNICTMQSAGCSGVNHAATAHHSSGDVFSEETIHASMFGSLIDKSGFGGCKEKRG